MQRETHRKFMRNRATLIGFMFVKGDGSRLVVEAVQCHVDGSAGDHVKEAVS